MCSKKDNYRSEICKGKLNSKEERRVHFNCVHVMQVHYCTDLPLHVILSAHT